MSIALAAHEIGERRSASASAASSGVTSTEMVAKPTGLPLWKNSRVASPVCQARSPTLWLGRWNWQERFDQLPQRIRNEHASHVKVPLRANRMPDLLPLY